MLRLNRVTKRFGGLTAVNNVTLNVRPNRISALIGPNGSGKTTVFNLISGILPLSEGSINLEDIDLRGLRPDQIMKLGISRTFQELKIFNSLSVIENVVLGLQARAQSGTLSSLLGFPNERRERKRLLERAEELLELLGIGEQKGMMPRNLPYGDQRITDIARALAGNAKIILLDEPAAGMNPKEKEKLSRALMRIQKEICHTMFLIEHDMKFVMTLSDHIGVLNFGNLIAEGGPEEIQKDEDVIKAYLGTE